MGLPIEWYAVDFYFSLCNHDVHVNNLYLKYVWSFAGLKIRGHGYYNLV